MLKKWLIINALQAIEFSTVRKDFGSIKTGANMAERIKMNHMSLWLL